MRAIRIRRDAALDSNGGVSSEQLPNISDVVMSMAIIDRDEQFRMVSEVVLESLKGATPERIDGCLQKMRSVIFSTQEESGVLAKFDQTMHLASNPISAHGEFDISRIFDLLDD